MSTWPQHTISTPGDQHRAKNGLKSDEQPSDAAGTIDHTSALSGDFGKLYNQSDYSDIELVVGSEHFYAHRIILAARSEYFRALFYGGLRESYDDHHRMEIKECTVDAFRILLSYIYTGQVHLAVEKEEILLDLLGLVHQYGFEKLEQSLSVYLKTVLSVDNVCIIYDTACLYELNGLKQHCAQFLDDHVEEIIRSDDFLALSPNAFSSIISRHSFYCTEIEIFHAVQKWHEYYYRDRNETHKPIDQIVSQVRLPLISIGELLKTVRYSSLFDLNHILDAIAIIYDQTNDPSTVFGQKNYRGRLRLNENIATPGHHAQVIEGELKHALLDGDTKSYDLDRGYTRHLIDDVHHICVQLNEPSIINHIKLLLWDKDTRLYSYYIEVSVDKINWICVIDYRSYLCRSWQKLYFPSTVARFIRIVGTHNTVNKIFHLVSMEASYVQKPFALVGDVTVPLENIATIAASAMVSEGVSRVRNALINGDYQSYDWDTGYTCHQIGSGGIIIQLSQPYVVSSMRLLLWDCDNRAYSYYIETSSDNATWSRVVDRQTVPCRSWQILTFSPRIVLFVRICGTHNTANEVFHCVHFECPCQPEVLKSHMKDASVVEDTEDIEGNVKHEEFYRSYEPLLDTVNENSSMQSQRILPFTSRSDSSRIFPIERETKAKQ